MSKMGPPGLTPRCRLGCVPSFHVQSQRWLVKTFSHWVTVTLTSCFPLLLRRTLVITLGPHG